MEDGILTEGQLNPPPEKTESPNAVILHRLSGRWWTRRGLERILSPCSDAHLDLGVAAADGMDGWDSREQRRVHRQDGKLNRVNRDSHQDARHQRQPGPLGAHGVRSHHGASQHPQRGLLRAQLDDPGYGHLLRRRRPDHRRCHGMEEEQHVRYPGLHLLRPLLAYSGGYLAVPHRVRRRRAATKTSEFALAWFFVFWGLFTFYMFIGTLKLNRALQTVFGLLTILFFLLAARDFGGGAIVGKIAGWEGILTGLSALYAAMAQILNETYKRVVLPLGSVSQLPRGFVQDFGNEIAGMWLTALRESAQTPSYGVVSDEELVTASEFALAQVDEHFSGRPAEGDIAAFFHKLGATRAAQGLPLPELISAVLLLKREIWTTARTHGVWESAMDLQKAVDLNRELGRFFDRAVYHATAGYTGYPFRAKDAF